MSKPSINFVFSNPIHFLAFGFGSGLSPKAPGTFGTIAALPLWLFIAPLNLYLQLLVIAAAFLLGIYICDKTSEDLKVHDHGGIVWDEFVGVWVTLVFVPSTWVGVFAAFLVFRFFDIVKPWPIKWLDKHVHGGFGIMVDDLIAGLFAGVLLFAVFSYI